MSCSAALTISPCAQSIYSSSGANRTWHVSVQNLDTYTDGALQFQIRASCDTAPQCPSPAVSLGGNNVGQPQLCSGKSMKLDPHLGSLCVAEHRRRGNSHGDWHAFDVAENKAWLAAQSACCVSGSSHCENAHCIHANLIRQIALNLVLCRSWAMPGRLRRLPVQFRVWECRLRQTGA